MAITILPEYEYYTGVEIKLYLGGDDKKVIELSKFGEHFQSLTITEGSPKIDGTQLQMENHDGGVASGKVSLYDEDNSIFRALLVSKTQGGQQLENILDITVKAYTGIRRYPKCRVKRWTCGFSGGVPSITLEWQNMPDNTQQAEEGTPSFKEVKMRELLVEKGVANFGEFKQAIRDVFSDAYVFKYSTSRELEENQLKEIEDDGKILYYNGDKQEEYTITIPESICVLDGNEVKKYRMRIDPTGDTASLLRLVMDQFCHAVNGESQVKINWKIVYGNVLLIYTFNNYNALNIPMPKGTAPFLEESIFVYNSSMKQGQLYKTPLGVEKMVFVVDSLSTTFDNSNVVIANFNTQANANNPNGNLILTSRGAITIPSGMPQAISESISKLTSILLAQELQVTMTVYNFIQFYVEGVTPIELLVFDHLGQVHPLTGKMRIVGYNYMIDGGVVKADVTLKPVLDNSLQAQYFNTPASADQSNNTTSYPPSSATEYPPANASGAGLSSGVTIQSGVDYKIS